LGAASKLFTGVLAFFTEMSAADTGRLPKCYPEATKLVFYQPLPGMDASARVRASLRYKPQMRALVIGAGGVGGVLAERLANAGHDVRVVARGDHGEAIARFGLCVRERKAERQVALHVLRARDVADASVDVAFLCVKWPELESALQELARVLAPHGVAVPLLNGLDSEDVVASYVGAQRTLAGVAYMSAGIVSPGVVYEHGHSRLGLASYRPGQERDLAERGGFADPDPRRRTLHALVKNGVECAFQRDLCTRRRQRRRSRRA